MTSAAYCLSVPQNLLRCGMDRICKSCEDEHGFAQGLRERNWTSEYYNEGSEPWKIEVFEDSGRLLQPSWPGFRATVTDASGKTSWVNMPAPGAETYTHVSTAQSRDRLQGMHYCAICPLQYFVAVQLLSSLMLHAGFHGWWHQGWHLAATEGPYRECVHAPVGIQPGVHSLSLYNGAFSGSYPMLVSKPENAQALLCSPLKSAISCNVVGFR